MKCLAKNTKGNRCKRNGNWKRFYFCKSHGIFKSNWYFLENQNYRIPISIFCSIVIFILTAIVTWEIEEWWSNSGIRKNISTTTETIKNIKTKFSGKSHFNILLLPFGSSQSCNEETILCERELKKILVTNQNESEIKIDYSIDNKELIFSKKELKEIVENTGADIIIWGDYSKKCDYDTTLVQVNYFIPDNINTAYLPVDKFEISEYHPVSSISEISEGKVVGDIQNIYNWISGYKEFNQGDFTNALKYLNKVEPINSHEYAQLFHSKGLCHQNLEDYSNGIINYTKAIKLDTNFYWSYNNRGNCLVNIQKYNEAIKDFNKVIQYTEGKYADAYLNRGILYRNKGIDSLAISDFNNAMISIGKHGGTKNVYSLITANRGVWICNEGHLSQGLKDIKRGFDNKQIIELDMAEVICLIVNKELTKADSIINEHLDKNPNEIKYIALKIEILRRLGRDNQISKYVSTLKNNLGVSNERIVIFNVLGFQITV